MADKPKIEVFSAGSAICQDAIETVKRDAGSCWEVIVHDIKDMQVVRRAKLLGIRFVPAVVVVGKLRPVPLTGGRYGHVETQTGQRPHMAPPIVTVLRRTETALQCGRFSLIIARRPAILWHQHETANLHGPGCHPPCRSRVGRLDVNLLVLGFCRRAAVPCASLWSI